MDFKTVKAEFAQPTPSKEALEWFWRNGTNEQIENTLDHLLQLRTHDDVIIRRWTVMLLSKLSSPQAIDAVGRSLWDSEAQVRRRVASFLVKYPQHEALVPSMIDALLDESLDLAARDMAAMTLGGGKHHQGISALITTLNSEADALWRRCIHALMQMERDELNDDVTNAIARIIKHPRIDDKTQMIALRSLAQLDSDRARDMMASLQPSDDES